jgi:hypothetical protein
MADAASMPQLLDYAIDQVEAALSGADGEAHAEAAVRGALMDATGRSNGAARLAGQMRLWYREAPDRARLLSRAALAETVVAMIGRPALA